MVAKMQARLHGDPAATPAKADALLRLARAEVAQIKGNGAVDRMKLRQAANKGWLALSTGADAYLCATEGRTVKNRSDVLKVYKKVSQEVAGHAALSYDTLHIGCGYEDRPSCDRLTIQAGFRLAGQALAALSRKMPKKSKGCKRVA